MNYEEVEGRGCFPNSVLYMLHLQTHPPLSCWITWLYIIKPIVIRPLGHSHPLKAENLNPGELTPGELTPSELAPDELTPGELTSDEPIPGELAPGELTPEI